MTLKAATERSETFAFQAKETASIRLNASRIRKKCEKRILFSKNKAGELLKTKGNGKKQTENKPETKLPKLLKTIEGPKNQTENKAKNKAGHLVENRRS